MELKVGMSNTIQVIVDESNTAARQGNNLPPVFSTPHMISAMETASYQCIEPALPQGKGSVGTHVNVSHDMAAPIGTEVTVTATVTEIDRRRVEFSVLATCPKGQVGAGTHTRFIIDLNKFQNK
ncbi:thioesterase family protein [Clostridium minihomine]|uniref:thioesterase family protein n=1 Tax=Clostridium minihomine TaxID=2045012 RepID=UPI000C7831B3|nr:thioesterase family protein [Clostridium minihomine]